VSRGYCHSTNLDSESKRLALSRVWVVGVAFEALDGRTLDDAARVCREAIEDDVYRMSRLHHLCGRAVHRYEEAYELLLKSVSAILVCGRNWDAEREEGIYTLIFDLISNIYLEGLFSLPVEQQGAEGPADTVLIVFGTLLALAGHRPDEQWTNKRLLEQFICSQAEILDNEASEALASQGHL